MALRSLSLCAGIGGIDLGLAGLARTVCYLEREAFAAAVLVQAMREGELDEAPIWSDLRTFDARAWAGAVDLVCAGYPCQPFSVAGKQLGEDDERHLWPEVLRILVECDAPLAFLENVPGHLHLGFADVLGDLAEIGFDAEWGLFTAQEIGAPHRRERLFVLAYRDGDGLESLRRCGLLDGERPTHWNDADGCGASVADAPGERRERRDAPEPSGNRQGLCATTTGRGEELGDADRAGRSNRGSGRVCAGRGAWPPAPGDRAGWERWIAEGGPQPCLRRGADGLAGRVDRLRALGNAVVPAQARLAYETLADRILKRDPRSLLV